LTTLKGVLEKTEDLVAKQRNAITTMSNIGRTVRGVYQLKDQLEAIVISRMGALRSINTRLRKGIFDPEADMRDFEEYLRNSIGRKSQDTVANLQRLMKMDNQLKRLNDDLENARAGRAGTVLLKDEARSNRDAELAKPESDRCASCIANLNGQIVNYDLLIAHYDSEIARLECQIEDRKKKYNIQMDERVKFGEQVQSMNKAWSRFNDSLDELQRTLSKY
jgi:chromosome segregation ATPase